MLKKHRRNNGDTLKKLHANPHISTSPKYHDHTTSRKNKRHVSQIILDVVLWIFSVALLLQVITSCTGSVGVKDLISMLVFITAGVLLNPLTLRKLQRIGISITPQKIALAMLILLAFSAIAYIV